MTDPSLFCIAVLIVLATPGPTNTLLFTSGAAVGFYRSLRLVLAELAGYLISISAIGYLLGPVIAHTPSANIALRIAAGIYLLFVAAKLWKARLRGTGSPVSFRNVFVATLLNPKALLFALLVIPLADPNSVAYMLGFSSILVIVGSAWIAVGTLAGTMMRENWSRLIPKAAAVTLSTFAAVLIGSAAFR